MASVWKRLQRVNKRAAKFQYTASYHRIDLETSPKWKPNKLSVVWTRRSRRVVTEPLEWEPSLKDPLKGSVIYPLPENHSVAVTLFKDSRTNELEDKDWTFVLEDVSVTGKRRRLAVCAVNMRKYASLEPTQRALLLTLDPTTPKVAAATLHLTLHCVLLREGQATDEDMQSLASLLSVNNNSDIAVLEDLDEDDYTLSDHSTKQMLDFRQQMEEMTQSLTSSDVAATPNSVQSLNFDNSRTPTAPVSPEAVSPTTPVPLDTPVEPSRPEYLNNLTKMMKEPPKMPSLPKYTTVAVTEPKIDNLKGVIFKPKTVTKRNLKPLELKSNLNRVNVDSNEKESKEESDRTPAAAAAHKLFPSKVDRDKTPVQDLLEWCQSATREYPSCRVTNLTTSFRSGLAFCAIVHNYRPDLIDFSGLQPEASERNVRAALDASAALGVPQVLAPADVCAAHPDRLAIMTYLFQLRAHFTGNELQVEQLGNSASESSYLVGRHDTDGSMPHELFSREVCTRRSRTQLPPVRRPQEEAPRVAESAPSPAPLNPDALNILESPPARPEKLMTRKELTDPFGSDDEDEQHTPHAQHGAKLESKSTIVPATTDPLTAPHESPPPAAPSERPSVAPELPKPTPQLLTRHDELKERARQLLEATKKEARERNRRQSSKESDDDSKHEQVNGFRNGDVSPKKALSEEERQAMLRERARKLIADARAGIVSPTSPNAARAPRGTLEIITKQSLMDEIAAAGGNGGEVPETSSARSSPGSRHSFGSIDKTDERGGSARGSPDERRSPLHSFSGIVDALADDGDADDESRNGERGSYIAQELEALEREQRAVDERAAALEKQLRAVMDSADDAQEEDRLMAQWFTLVNKKNALLRRQMQLNILEQEEDLSRRCELLARELRLSLGVEEWRKSSGQRRRERLLLRDLLAAVDSRDRLVHEMDQQERAIAEDNEIEMNLSQMEMQRKNNCILQ